MGHWLRRIWYLLNRRRLQRELDREMASHRAMMADQRHFGSTIRLREQSADVWGWTWLDALCQDIRFGARLLVKDRRLTLAAVAALALGLGATTTAFTFVNGALRDIPLADPDRLVWIRTVDARGRHLGVSYADVRDWREAARTLSHVIVSLELPMNVAESGLSPQRYSGSYISFNAFSMVGRVPVLGRGFRPHDDRADAPRVAIIAHTVWQNRYGGDPSVIGRTVRVSEVPATIIGVMPEGFHFPLSSEVWVPAAHVSGPPGTVDARRGNRGVLIFAFGRLADGIRLPQAQADMDAITSRLARDYPATNEGISVALEPIENLYWGGEWAIRQILLVVMAAVSFVLIIACVNVANLLLARAIHRSREMAVRSSLGATRGRIVRQLFVESVLLAAVAGALGFLVSLYGVKAFGEAFARMWALDGPPLFWMRFSMDGRVYTFLAAVCLGASILFGLAPALQISNASSDALKDGGRGASGGLRARRWTGALIVSQLALTLVLLAGTGLMLRSFLVVYQAGRALDTSNMITMQLALAAGKYPQPADIKQFYRQLDERLASVRTFSAITVASDIPMLTVINALRELTIEGRPVAPGDRPPTVAYLYIGPRYFETLRLRLIQGREFTEDDGAPGREAAIVNQRFASMFFPNGDVIGQRIRPYSARCNTIPRVSAEGTSCRVLVFTDGPQVHFSDIVIN
jgi:putative ABC transport system permease protein